MYVVCAGCTQTTMYRMHGSKTAPYVFDTSAFHGGRMSRAQDAQERRCTWGLMPWSTGRHTGSISVARGQESVATVRERLFDKLYGQNMLRM